MTLPKVFISYTYDSPEHRKWVQSLAQRIERQGVDVWLDSERLVPGQRWTDELRRAWQDCNVAIIIFSGHDRTSEYARLELETLAKRAEEGSLRLIPVLRAGEWSKLPEAFREWFGVDMRNDQEILEKLVTLQTAVFQSIPTGQVISSGTNDSDANRLISRLRLQKVKLLEDVEINFRDEDERPRSWTCILADNGCGKTTILQSIALAAVGDTLATKLTDDPRSFAPAYDPTSSVSIEADFENGPGDTLRTRLELVAGSHDWFGAGPENSLLRDIRNRRRDGFFVAAYGAGRRLSRAGQVAVPADPVLSRVRNLFDQEYRILGLEFGDAFHDPALRSVFLDFINRLIRTRQTAAEELLPGVVGVEYAAEAAPGAAKGDVVVTLDFGQGQFQLGPALLSSGYQSVLAWIGELVGHQLLDFGAGIELSELRGLVLIDELDLHLHPTWQRRVVPVLRSMFPNMQFVITTHSPLVLTGFAASEIVAIGLEGGRLVQRNGVKLEPAMQSGSQLYSSYFNTQTATRPGLVEKEREVLSLYARRDQLTNGEREHLTGLEKELAPFWQAPLRDPATVSSVPDAAALQSILKALEQP